MNLEKYPKKPVVFRRRKILLHPLRTVRLFRGLLADKRVTSWHKIVFTATIVGFTVVFIFPNILEQTFLAAVLPVIGNIIGLPVGAGFDWATFAIVSKFIFQIFPEDVAMEHYSKHFGRPGS